MSTRIARDAHYGSVESSKKSTVPTPASSPYTITPTFFTSPTKHFTNTMNYPMSLQNFQPSNLIYNTALSYNDDRDCGSIYNDDNDNNNNLASYGYSTPTKFNYSNTSTSLSPYGGYEPGSRSSPSVLRDYSSSKLGRAATSPALFSPSPAPIPLNTNIQRSRVSSTYDSSLGTSPNKNRVSRPVSPALRRISSPLQPLLLQEKRRKDTKDRIEKLFMENRPPSVMDRRKMYESMVSKYEDEGSKLSVIDDDGDGDGDGDRNGNAETTADEQGREPEQGGTLEPQQNEEEGKQANDQASGGPQEQQQQHQQQRDLLDASGDPLSQQQQQQQQQQQGDGSSNGDDPDAAANKEPPKMMNLDVILNESNNGVASTLPKYTTNGGVDVYNDEEEEEEEEDFINVLYQQSRPSPCGNADASKKERVAIRRPASAGPISLWSMSEKAGASIIELPTKYAVQRALHYYPMAGSPPRTKSSLSLSSPTRSPSRGYISLVNENYFPAVSSPSNYISTTTSTTSTSTTRDINRTSPTVRKPSQPTSNTGALTNGDGSALPPLLLLDKGSITDISLTQFLTKTNDGGGVHITELDLEGCHWLSNRTLVLIGEFCPRLRILNLQGCHQLSDNALIRIAEGCKHLTSINVGDCVKLSEVSIYQVLTRCNALSVLCLHSCPLIVGACFEALAHCTNVAVLDLSYCEALQDIALEYIAEHLPKLTLLDIGGCKSISDSGMLAVCKRCSELQTLRLALCDQLTAESLSQITSQSTQLTEIDLTGCVAVTDACLSEITENTASLEHISLDGCSAITDASLDMLTRRCPKLRTCELCACKLLTLPSLTAFIERTRYLCRLVISECNVTDEELATLRATRPSCEIVKHTSKPIVRKKVVLFASEETKQKKKGKKGGAKKGAKKGKKGGKKKGKKKASKK